MVVILMIAAYVSMVLLAITFSPWWWLLLLILAPLTIFLVALNYTASFLLQRLIPRELSSEERSQLNRFTEKLFGVAERTRTPYPVLLFLIAKDVIRGKESHFLNNMIGDSKGLIKEFGEIQKLFKK